MKFKLPTLSEEFDIETKNVTTKNGYIDCEINFSVDAQITWEDNFPEQAKIIGLFDYVQKMKDVNIVDQATATIALKIIYCFILFDRQMSFREFSRLFTFEDIDYFHRLCSILTDILSFINKRNDAKKNS